MEARIHLVDSAPVILISRGRGGHTPTIEPQNRAEWYGVCTSQDLKVFGGRVLASSLYPDLKVFPALCDGYAYLICIGDKRYVGAETGTLVWERGRHQLLALRRAKQHDQWPEGIQ